MGFTSQIKVTAKLLNCRLQPSMNAKILSVIKMDEVHNIVAEQNGWGQLENGSWINLDFTVPYKHEEPVEIPAVFVTGMTVGELDSKEKYILPEFTTTTCVSAVDHFINGRNL